MKALPLLNLALAAILVCAIAYNLLRGFSAQVDAYATDKMFQAQRERDSVMKEVDRWRTEALDLTAKADSIASELDRAKAAQETNAQVRSRYTERMRYAPIKDVLDTLATE